MLIDHHIHTARFSFDGEQSIDELIEAARKRGLDGLCLAEHFEKDVFYIAGQESVFDPDEYFHAVQQYRHIARGQGLRLLHGIELGYLPHLDAFFSRLILRYPFDAVVLSLHILDGEDPYVSQKLFQKSRTLVYGRYLEQLKDMLRACPEADIVGHFDYISRYAPYPDRKIRYQEQPDRFDNFLKTVIETGKTLEINTATVQGLRSSGYGHDDSWPDEKIIKRYLELGGEYICLSSDAHRADDVARLFPEGLQWLRSLGCRYLTHYEGKKALPEPI
jgi:histidinol-phosphatase (PHP family)